jgi:hypothetical protein
MLSIRSIAAQPFFELEYQNAGPGGGRIAERLPWLRGEVEGLPAGLDALVLTADLQGRAIVPVAGGTAWVLLGVAVADAYAGLAAEGRVPAQDRTLAILAGDLYTVPLANQRGGTGDVREVWRAFSCTFHAVAGVAGNHDLFGETRGEREAFRREPGIHLLDGGLAEVAGLRIAGVGGIPGDPRKVNRVEPRDFAGRVEALVREHLDLLVLHAGPPVPEQSLPGAEVVLGALGFARELAVVCGHVHWKHPRASLRPGLEVVNVDARVLLLCRPGLS